MKSMISVTSALVLILATATTPAKAKGCIKGALLGGAAGHYAGHHGVIGAAVGCWIGRREARKHERELSQQDGVGSAAIRLTSSAPTTASSQGPPPRPL